MEELLDIAVLAYRSGKYNAAIELLTQIVDSEKQNWLAWFYLGMSHLKTDDTERAYKIMRVIAALCPLEQLRASAAAVVPSSDKTATRDKKYIEKYDWKKVSSG